MTTFPSNIEKTIRIQASPATVWDVLCNPRQMKLWMAEPEMELEVITDWRAGNPIVIRGFHHIAFENKGTVLQFEPHSVLEYNYLSSVSRLPDIPQNHTVVRFMLVPVEGHTSLTLLLRNFPTESIWKHVQFYWQTTLEVIRDFAERSDRPLPAL